MYHDECDKESQLVAAQILEKDARRPDMDLFDRADAYASLRASIEKERGQCSNKDLAEVLGVTPQKVSEVIKLLELPHKFRDKVRDLDLGHRATVDMVRDLIKAESPEDILEQVSDRKPSTGKMRRKTMKFEQSGYEVIIKSPDAEQPSNEAMIEQLELVIKKLKDG